MRGFLLRAEGWRLWGGEAWQREGRELEQKEAEEEEEAGSQCNPPVSALSGSTQ